MKRILLDTAVITAAFRSRHGASNELLRLVVFGRVRPLATTALFLECAAVLKRPEQRSVTGLGIEQIDRILAALASVMEPVAVHFRWRPQLTDPGDEMVLEAAINGRADALVTHNVRDFVRPAKRFGLPVVRPGELVKRLRP